MRQFLHPVIPAVALLVAAASACSGGSSEPEGSAFEGLHAPMALHLAPDGRVVVAEAGTGADDGRVVVVGADGRGLTVVLDGLPSVAGAGEPWGDTAGVAGAAMAPDGVVCAAVGIPAATGRALSELRCSDGLVVDLLAWETENDPDGLGAASRAFDVVPEENNGWWVSDALGNTVLHVDRAGEVVLAGVFPSFGTFATAAEGRTVGLALAGTSQYGAASLGPRGGLPERGGLVVALFNGALAVVRPVDPPDPGLGLANTPSAIAAFATEERLYYLLHGGDMAGIYDTTREPLWQGEGGTGLVRLPDGSFLVAIAREGRVVVVESPLD